MIRYCRPSNGEIDREHERRWCKGLAIRNALALEKSEMRDAGNWKGQSRMRSRTGGGNATANMPSEATDGVRRPYRGRTRSRSEAGLADGGGERERDRDGKVDDRLRTTSAIGQRRNGTGKS